MVTQSSQNESLISRYGKTLRTDRWWFEPLLVGIGLFIFVEVSAPKNIHKDFECLVISTPESIRIERLDKDRRPSLGVFTPIID